MLGKQGNSISEPSTNWSTHRIAGRLNGQKSQAKQGPGKPITFKPSSVPQYRQKTENKHIRKEYQFLVVKTVYISAC
jgi:hypothetical protein